MSETILIVGSGAREHALAKGFACSPQRPALLCFGSTRNPGIATMTRAYTTGDLTNPSAIVAFANQHRPTLAIIGPEAPLAAGVADALWAAGIPAVGPTARLASIESSKGFARELLRRHGIAGNPVFARFDSLEGVEAMLSQLGDRHVIKDDGLAGGKGVKVFGDHLHSREESLAYCRELAAAGHSFVIEEKLEGEEFSLLSFSDGATLKHMPAVQDHKRAYNGDSGPNTGGMGTYTDADGSLPFLREGDITAARRMNERVIAALARDCGAPYKGILYGGFMATRDGVRLIEYNARFGDPEALNLLTLLETDLVAICRAIVEGRLDEINVAFAREATVCKYLVPEGYPEHPRRGDVVSLPPSVPASVTMYLGSVDAQQEKMIAMGARTVGVVARAASLTKAEQLCEAAVRGVTGRFFHRSDIGTAAAIEQRITHMAALRSR
ncbi:MAG TPA: phosphoribosylamine--glycine ligase [Acidobacteriaceae bacterium]|jgi:phosphoribosylamine--glycine ligase|nr:phosphoribosylamine--glycine ligase [Acidobacteriaceae bacterium]